MEVDETMITGHLDHARFSGERFGRILNLLIRFAQRISHGRSTRSLEEDVAGRVAKRHFARACGLWSPKRLSRQNRPFRPAARRGRIRVSPLRKQACLWVRAWSRFAPLFTKKGLIWGRVMRHTPIPTQQAKDKPTLEGLTHRTGLTHRIEGLHSHHVTHVPNAAHKQGKSPMEHALTRSLSFA